MSSLYDNETCSRCRHQATAFGTRKQEENGKDEAKDAILYMCLGIGHLEKHLTAV